MSVQRVASRYAKSLIDLAQERNELETVHGDVQSFDSLTANRDFYLMLKSPVISAGKKLSILDALLKDKYSELTMAFLRILVKKGREPYLPEVADEFIRQYREIKGISTVQVTTAVPLSEALMADIRRKLAQHGVTEQNIDLQAKVDPELIGGFILEFDGKIYDDSVAHKLEEMRKNFGKRNIYVSQVSK